MKHPLRQLKACSASGVQTKGMPEEVNLMSGAAISFSFLNIIIIIIIFNNWQCQGTTAAVSRKRVLDTQPLH